MDDHPRITNKFLTYPTHEDLQRIELSIPVSFLDVYGDGMKSNVKVILHDGSHIIFCFDKHRRVFFGIEKLFIKNAFESISFFLFEYFDIDCFVVHVFNHGGCVMQSGALAAAVDDAKLRFPGWCSIQGVTKFVIEVDCTFKLVDITLPPQFLKDFGQRISKQIMIVLNNGQAFEGRFCDSEKQLHCFCGVMHFISCGRSTRLMFTYNGLNMFYVSAFDINGIERSLLHEELDYSDWKRSNEIEFSIQIRASHLYKYCHGVYIQRKFHDLTDHWRNGCHIVAFKENLSWQIKVLKRKKRVTLHDGWTSFCIDMNLNVGDICFFFIRQCYSHFDVEIVKNSVVDE